MKEVKIRFPYTKKPRKKYPFRTPIPPCSIVAVKRLGHNPWQKEIGRIFRIGYYSRMDGLDEIWLVDENGKYDQALDHDYLHRFFDILFVSKERSMYGGKRPPFGPIDWAQLTHLL